MISALRIARAAVRIAIASPGTAWLIVRMLAWKAALAVLKRGLTLPRLVRLVEPPSPASLDDRERGRVEFAVRRLGRVLGGGDCLERSLVAYRFLTLAGARPRLLIGFDRGENRLEGHAWVMLNGRPVAESPESLERYVEIASFTPAPGGPGGTTAAS